MRTIQQFKKDFPGLSPQRRTTAYHLLEVVGVSEELESPSRQSSCDTEAILDQILSNIQENGNYIPWASQIWRQLNAITAHSGSGHKFVCLWNTWPWGLERPARRRSWGLSVNGQKLSHEKRLDRSIKIVFRQSINGRNANRVEAESDFLRLLCRQL